MKNKSLIVLFFLLLGYSCWEKREKAVKVPEGILSEEVFTEVLKDMALAESAATMNIKNVSANKIDSVYAFDPLKENNITKAQFDSAVAFYVNYPELYKKIYENLLVALREMETRRDPATKDSALK